MKYFLCTTLLALGCIAGPVIGDNLKENFSKHISPIITKDPNPQLRVPISLNAQNASLSEILKVLSDRSRMNFVSGEGVRDAKITIILNKTPVSEAIDLIVRAAGLSYEIIGNSVLIGDGDKLKAEVGQSGYVIRLNYADAREAASMLKDFSENIQVDKGGNRLIVYASPRVINEIERIVQSIDHPHTQILMETRIIEVSVDDVNQFGIDWGAASPIQTAISYPSGKLTDAIDGANFLRGAVNIPVTLDALIHNGDARLLMNSKLTTTNNREATLHIGEKIPFVIQSYNSAATAGGGAQRQIQHEEVGVKVRMLPHINEDNEITLMLEPEISSIAGFKGPNNDIPMVKVRKTKTTVRVRDGQTIFLAGLLSEEETEQRRKLPILGQIPLLGVLFSHSQSVKRRTNLIIEIKPKIIYKASQLQFGNIKEGTPAKRKMRRKK